MKKLSFIIVLTFCMFLCGCSMNTPKNFFTKIKNKCIELTKPQPKTTMEKIKARDYILVGTKTDAKPFCYLENGENKGYDIDIAKAIAKTILDDENKVKFVPLTEERRITKLLTEEVDMVIATMTDTPERRELIDFSYDYYVSGQAVMCKKGTLVKSPADLHNYNTAVVVGTTAEKTLIKSNAKGKVLRFKTYIEAYNAIKDSNDTCLIADDTLLKGFIMDHPNYFIFNSRLTVEPYAVAIRTEDEELKEQIDYTIQTMKNNGELENLSKKWVK